VRKRTKAKKIEGLGCGDLSEEARMEIVAEAARMLDREEELYVQTKIARAKQAADEGRIVTHEEVKRRFVS